MKKIFFALLIAASSILVGACTSPEEDAKKAADLHHKSIVLTRQNELVKAAQAYAQSQDIVKKYEGTDQFDQFYEAYSVYITPDKGESNQE